MNKQLIKEDKRKRNEFVASQEIQIIRLSDIFLKESIHLNAKCDFTEQIEKLKEKNISILNNPIIVKQETDDTYSLISGYKGYMIAKALNHDYIPVVIIEDSRKSFIRQLRYDITEGSSINIDDIIVPKSFLKRNVGAMKLYNAMNYYNIHNEFDKPVKIRITAIGNKLLVDGYARYVAAKVLGVKKLPFVLETIQKEVNTDEKTIA